MRRLLGISAFLAGMITTFFVLQMPSCTHDDKMESVIPPSDFEYGDDIVSEADGWTYDKTHSSVRWETLYLGTAALLTGRFNNFSTSINFEQDDENQISLSGQVVLSSVNTGEPGRDAGCLLGTFGTEVSDQATVVSKSVKKDGKGGYIVTADLTFHGVTSEVLIQLNYSGTEQLDLRGIPTLVAGFTAEFEINAKSVFGIVSDNIADRVAIKVNSQYKKPLQ
jgi:polyisoprenoid-binding protein YceI